MSVIINASTTSGLVMTSDLSGNLQFQNNGVNLPMGGVAPAFSAYASANQNITNATWTKVNINTEEFDTNNNFDSTTNYRFTPTVAGYYQVNAALHFQNNITGQCICAIYKNGGLFKNGNQFGASTNDPRTVASVLMYMNGTTDYIELYGYKDSSISLGFLGGVTATYFQASLVRGA
jgi:hypothetical protein